MVNNTLGMQHVEARKRWFKKLERFPHPDAFKGLLDRLIYVIGILTIVMTVPQIARIWIGKTAIGVSPISWVFYLTASAFWMVYGIAHKSKPIIISYVGSIIVNAFVVIGIFIYQ